MPLGSRPASQINPPAVPGTQEERLSLCGSLKDYLTANPAKENAPLNVTAAQAGANYTALSDARTGVNNGNTLSAARNAICATLP